MKFSCDPRKYTAPKTVGRTPGPRPAPWPALPERDEGVPRGPGGPPYSSCTLCPAAASYTVSMLRQRRRRGFSLIELLIVISIILIIAAIAVPKMNNQLMAAHEMAAIRQITTIHQAETQYYSQFGKYAATLTELGPPNSGTAGAAAADLIPKVLAEGKNSSYLFKIGRAHV